MRRIVPLLLASLTAFGCGSGLRLAGDEPTTAPPLNAVYPDPLVVHARGDRHVRDLYLWMPDTVRRMRHTLRGRLAPRLSAQYEISPYGHRRIRLYVTEGRHGNRFLCASDLGWLEARCGDHHLNVVPTRGYGGVCAFEIALRPDCQLADVEASD